MKYKAHKIFMMFIVILIITLSLASRVMAAKLPKTILVILDQFSLDLVKKLDNHNTSAGLINNRTESIYEFDGKVSQIMTIAIGRRVKADDRLFNGIKKMNNDQLKIIGFDKIMSSIKKNSSTLIEEDFLMGEYLKNHGVKTGYIGKDSTALLAADRNGIIEFGVCDVKYEKEWLIDKTKKLFDKSDVMILSYDISNNTGREELLLEYLEELKGINVLIVSLDPLSPIVYKGHEGLSGSLTSNTTNRQGVLSNLDILPHIAFIFGLNNTYYIGNEINIISSEEPIAILEDNLIQSSNLNTIKYILHGLIIVAELYLIIDWKIRKKNDLLIYKKIINSILLVILLSFVLGLFKSYNNVILYLLVLILGSIIVSATLSNKNRFSRLPLVYVLSIVIYLITLYCIFLNQEILYTSFMGYNNILVGGRFYGMNNGMVGVFLATSILFYYTLRGKLKNDRLKRWIPIIILIVNLVALSGGYGANTGGYFTAIVLLVMAVYENLQKIGSRKLRILVIVGLISGLFIVNFYMDTIRQGSSHAGELILRMKDYGIIEFINIITIKINQLISMTLLSPWVIILIGQIYFIKSNYKEIVQMKVTKVIFFISVIGLLTNDTGVIAFVYMNTFLLGVLTSLHNIEKRDLC